ncbi:hypothetical protein AGDE_05632 [Angomonas deanei]|nr:hypothetical protein AGDE_05632 [Angomonas deanei]|eukprot:EPY38297.1 hypothetical protein AGDE_05632 [Angomonas deanei]
MIMLIVTWAISVAKDGGNVLSRYAACIIAFVLLAITMVLSILVQKLQPRLSMFYAHQVMAILTLILMAISMGMNDVVVDLCNRKKQPTATACGSHVAELIAELLVCLTMAACYGSTQQRIVTFIDKGILDGIKGRSNGGMTQLP